MRVDVLSREYPPEVYGGAGVHVAELVRALRARDDVEARVRAFGAPRDEPLTSSYAELADLVAGTGSFDITFTDEYIEGVAPGIDRRLLRKLKHGDYSLEGHVDLHGMRRDEAREEIARFFAAARHEGKRCVLVVHGRGLRSKDNIPVLKELLVGWLTRGSIGAGVLAFCTARPSDGGAGAVYVLLRR